MAKRWHLERGPIKSEDGCLVTKSEGVRGGTRKVDDLVPSERLAMESKGALVWEGRDSLTFQ